MNLNAHHFGIQSMMMGGQHPSGHNRPVAGMMLPPMTGGQPMAGAAISAPPGMTFGRPGEIPEVPFPEWELDENGVPRLKQKSFEGPVRGLDRARAGREREMPFGGFRRRGGPVMPGVAYRVGEEGEETFVPSVPGVILPNPRTVPQRADPENPALMRPVTDYNPVNGRAATFDGLSRTEFFGKNAGKTGESVPVYNDIRQSMLGQTPQADPRSFAPGGSNFAGPPAPPREMPFGMGAPPQGPTAAGGPGMLVASSNGGYKWQPGSGPGTSAPPQSPMMFGMPAGNGPVLVRSGAKTENANQTGPLSGRGTAGLQTGSLSSRRGTPVGRSANDPMRIAEQMRRRGDPRALLQFGAQQMGQDFARERDAVNFAQTQMMFGQQQQAMDARDARNFDQGLMMFGMQQGAMDARDARNFEQQRQIEAERRTFEQEQQRGKSTQEIVNIASADGKGYVPHRRAADGTLHVAGSYMPNPLPEKPLPPGMVPQAAMRDGVQYGPKESPKPAAPPPTKTFKRNGQDVDMQWNAELGGWEPVRFLDANGDGIDDRAQQPGGSTAPSSFISRL